MYLEASCWPWVPMVEDAESESESESDDGGDGGCCSPVVTWRQLGVASSTGTMPLILSLNRGEVVIGLSSLAQQNLPCLSM